jgi:serine-type D-Ala-D-Ala carboxypeptidase (penicillin-binding protein 5/6)
LPTIFRFALAAVVFAFVAPAVAQAPIDTPAKYAFMVDFDTGAVLLAKNADELMPPSSMSKLMTAFMIFERLAAGTLKMEDTFGVSDRAWRVGGSASGGSTMFLPVGSRATVGDLLRGLIVQSGNDASIALAEGYAGTEERFAELMTKRAREFGVQRGTFKNATGLPNPEHLLTPREIALIAKQIIANFPQYYSIYSETDFTYNGIKQGNRNPLLYKNLGADGLKTGHTAEAGYGLTASAKRDGRRLILVVNGLGSMNERSRETERLLDFGFREYDNYTVVTSGRVVDEADVWLGAANKVSLITERDITVTLPRRLRPKVKVSIAYENPMPAPISKGAKIGTLRVDVPEGERIEAPLIAGGDVSRLDAGGRIRAAANYLLFGGGKK